MLPTSASLVTPAASFHDLWSMHRASFPATFSIHWGQEPRAQVPLLFTWKPAPVIFLRLYSHLVRIAILLGVSASCSLTV